ncbi:MAG: MGMT family protein [Chloroflexi bacterium]|nr:MGMT family protein [Chloroflexota bacterium]
MPEDQRAHRTAIFEIVERIPKGRIMTYGGIAGMIPPPSGIDYLSYARIRARWVGYALKRCPETLPWHRVVNAQGRISSRLGLGPALQRTLLEEEGVVFDELGRLDLERLCWEPDPGPNS